MKTTQKSPAPERSLSPILSNAGLSSGNTSYNSTRPLTNFSTLSSKPYLSSLVIASPTKFSKTRK
ncbi:MAG: hypothetical protein CL963_02100 [Euryarchaeota archaeon]|nr:hypothetical protein [Euryarchaeota archaeon]